MVNTEFVDALASDAAVPGGGGGAAYAGALAAALGAMVGNITAGKPKFADVADDMRASVVELDAAQLVCSNSSMKMPRRFPGSRPHGSFRVRPGKKRPRAMRPSKRRLWARARFRCASCACARP